MYIVKTYIHALKRIRTRGLIVLAIQERVVTVVNGELS
jgi:hypothetical protein